MLNASCLETIKSTAAFLSLIDVVRFVAVLV